MRVLLGILLILSICVKAQVPGNAVKLSGTGQHIGFGEILKDVKSISFWINLTQEINASNSQEIPVLVRDENGPNQFFSGEFGIYFGKSGTAEAGHLVFSRATVSSPHSILSDNNSWFTNRWYQITVIIHPTQGMKMYVNGVEQQDTDASTDPIYVRNEGTTGTVYLGKWGSVSGFGIQAKFDELRFYTTALSETQVRSTLCKVIGSPYQGLKGYFDFDGATTGFIPTLVGTQIGTATGLSSNAIVKSNVPVGQQSVFLYDFQTTDQLSFTDGATFTIDSLLSSARGIHMYQTNDFNLQIQGSLPYFLGVWFTDTVAMYNLTVDYSNMNTDCDSCSEILSRDFQTINQFGDRPVVPINCIYNLPNESPGSAVWREEYWLKPKLKVETGLPDTLSQCEGDPIILAAKEYIGAQYLWDDGSTQRIRSVDSAGLYTLNLKWHGCEVDQNIWVIEEYTPYFELPNDTSICAGDTIIIRAPLDIDSATYSWGYGIHFGKTFPMWYAGTIPLTITVGNCSWTDDITIDVIKPFQLYLGKDTTLCLGQKYVLEVPTGVDYVWSTGELSRKIEIFNQPQKIWVRAWNKCFEKTDTVAIDYEECDCRFFMANSFTPNNDGNNDVFLPVSSCYFEEFDLEIYDRWGALIYKTDNRNLGWDGTYKGKLQPQGVYTYQVRYKKYTWLEKNDYERGVINLIR